MPGFRTLAIAVLALALLSAPGVLIPAAGQGSTMPSCTLFHATGRYLCEPFQNYWHTFGGVETLGMPITSPVDTSAEDGAGRTTIQYYERQRIELEQNNDNSELHAALGRLGVEVLEARGRNWRVFPQADPQQSRYFVETGHAIDPLFAEYWSSHGLDLGDPGISLRESIALFGYPISELMIETNSSFDQVVVQWYERARMEYHPANPPGNRILLGRLGVELNPQVPAPAIRLEVVAEELTSPVAIVPSTTQVGAMYVVDQIGIIHTLAPDGRRLPVPFLDLRDRMVQLSPGYDERGLLGLALHPDHAMNGKLYVHYSAPLRASASDDWNHTARFSEFTLLEGVPHRVDPASERILLEVDQPHWAHNGSSIAFGPDGYLYIGLGDGGHGGDEGLGHADDWYTVNEGGNGQDIEANLLGSILRIDVDVEDGYAIPQDNPFIGRQGLDEIWAYGLRNPFRISFDLQGNDELFVGDVGQDRIEEVNIVTAGNNYGWNVREGSECYYNAGPAPPGPCPSVDAYGAPLVPPILEFTNTAIGAEGLGRAVIGGFVYRGADHPSLYGHYIFGSWSSAWNIPSGRIMFASRPAGGSSVWQINQLKVNGEAPGIIDAYLLGFGQDLAGELYVLTSSSLGPSGSTGKVYRLVS